MNKQNVFLSLLWITVLLVGSLLYALNMILGPLNQDEGWYLYAARMVSEGQFPFRDFAFTQGPVMPFVYSAIQSCIAEYGLLAGRMYTGILGGLAILLAALLAGRLAPAGWKVRAALLCFIMAALNVYQAYFFTVVKTYALTSVLLLSGLLLLVRAADRAAPTASALAGLAFAFAAGTRLSVGLALAVAGVYLLTRRDLLGHQNWIAFGIGGALGLLGLFGPFLVMNGDAVYFGLIQFHAQRDAGSWLSRLVYKAGFISRTVQAYFVAFSLLAMLILYSWHHTAARRSAAAVRTPPGYLRFLWVLLALITLLHLATNFPYDDYQVYLYPVFCVGLAVWSCEVLAGISKSAEQGEGQSTSPWPFLAPLMLLLVCGLASFSSPVNQEWFLVRRDVVWWRLKEKPDIFKLREAAAFIRERAAHDGEELLTQDTYLAVEAGLRVPRGLEMGPFSYYPDVSSETAEQLHLVNREAFRRIIIESPASMAALSDFSFNIRCPEVARLSEARRKELTDELEKRFVLKSVVPDFGQAHTPLKIYERKGMGYGEP